MALLQGMFGAEIQFPLATTFEIGPTVHHLGESNDLKNSLIDAWELGIKATSLIYSPGIREGVFISSGIYDYSIRVSQQFGQTEVSSSRFGDFGFTFTTGYQWNLRFLRSDAWTLRLGAGLGYRQEHIEVASSPAGRIPLGVRQRVDPTLEFSLGVAL